MPNAVEVTISIKRGKEEAKKYQLIEVGDSRNGTFKTYGPAAENADLPKFGKLYIKAKRGK